MAHIPVECIDWHPTRDSAVPLHDQIVSWVKGKVASGAWPLGARLPAQRELAQALGVNRSTLVCALSQLQSFGIVKGRGSAGTFIASDTWSILLADRSGWQRRGATVSPRGDTRLFDAIHRAQSDPATINLGSLEMDEDLLPRDYWSRAVECLRGTEAPMQPVDALGYAPLRDALCDHLAGRGVSITPDEVLITSGTVQAMRLVASGLLEPGTCAYVGRPTYSQALSVLPDAGIHVEEIASDEKGISVSGLLEHVRSRPGVPSVLYSMACVQNPTGRIASPTRRFEVLEAARSLRLPIIEDGAYDELAFDGPIKPLKADDTTGQIIYLGSAGRTVAPGLRVGWVVAPKAVTRRLADLKRVTDHGTATPSQVLLSSLMASGCYGEHLENLRQELGRRATAAQEVLEAEMGDLAHWQAPQGGYFCWISIDRTIPMDVLFSELLAEGVLLHSPDVFDTHHPGSLRLSFAAMAPERFAQGVEILARTVRGLSHQRASA